MDSSFENENKFSGFLKSKQLLDHLRTYQLFKTYLALAVKSVT
jgi:hypothetical protein